MEAQVVMLLNQGLTFTQVAEKLNITVAQVIHIWNNLAPKDVQR